MKAMKYILIPLTLAGIIIVNTNVSDNNPKRNEVKAILKAKDKSAMPLMQPNLIQTKEESRFATVIKTRHEIEQEYFSLSDSELKLVVVKSNNKLSPLIKKYNSSRKAFENNDFSEISIEIRKLQMAQKVLIDRQLEELEESYL
jgi:hypothetical protein